MYGTRVPYRRCGILNACPREALLQKKTQPDHMPGGAGVQPQRSAPMHIIVCVGMIMEQALVPVVFLVAAIQLRCTSGVAARRPSGAEHVNKIIIESM